MEIFERTQIKPMGFILNKHPILNTDASYYEYYLKARRIEPFQRVEVEAMRALQEEICVNVQKGGGMRAQHKEICV